MASSDDFSTLREQALRRMHQMHANSEPPPEPIEEKSVNEDTSKPPSPPRRTASPLSGFLNSLAGFGGQKGQKSILDELHIDEDTAIIGILIYILYKNGADIKLMLALGYLLI